LEAEKSNEKVIRMELNLEGVKRKKKYMKLDDRVERSTKRYERDGNVGKFLNIMSYVMRLD
jgi:hypothetical protein